ncbi:RXLR effector domain-containing protein [Phytophthora infestans]|uniref:RxLR effector protein n=1 Tax=Phytophthora infestans TaxID=4787 RepID=A0A8S9UFJ9_PHYIN|nr:RXLR effector domain-containing protein [Phytophthora infestans]
MRLSSVVSVAIAIVCLTTSHFAQARISLPDLVGGRDDAASMKGIRTSKENEEERGALKTITNIANRVQVKTAANGLLADSGKAHGVYRKWAAKGYTLDDIRNFLKVTDPKMKGKYQQIVDDYNRHLFLNWAAQLAQHRIER